MDRLRMSIRSARFRTYWIITGLLVVCLLALWGWRSFMTESSVEARTSDQVERVQNQIIDRYKSLRTRLVRQAQTFATDSTIVRGLRTASGPVRPTPLTNYLATLNLDDRTAVEVYSPTPRLLAWAGFSMPLDRAPDHEAFLSETQVSIVSQNGVRTALVVWVPVRDNDRVVGAVRLMRLVDVSPPVQNRFLEAYRISDDWSHRVRLPIDVSWGYDLPDPSSPSAVSLYLYDLHQRIVGHVQVILPSVSQRLILQQERIDRLLSGVGAFLLIWLLMGGTWWHHNKWKHADREHLSTLVAPALRMGGLLAALGAARYLLIYFDIPAQWLEGMGVGRALFDPTNLASGIGRGLMQSVGDLLITGCVALFIGGGLFHLATKFRLPSSLSDPPFSGFTSIAPHQRSWIASLGLIAGYVVIVLGGGLLLGYIVERTVLDSTIDFFSRTGILPEPLTLTVFSGLTLLAIGGLLGAIAFSWITIRLLAHVWPRSASRTIYAGLFTWAILVAGAVLFWGEPSSFITIVVAFVIAAGTGILAWQGMRWPHYGLNQLTLQRLLPALIILATLVYALLYVGLDEQRKSRMVEAGQSFAEGRNPHLLFALQQIVEGVSTDLQRWETAPVFADSLDAVATDALRSSLLTSMSPYESRLILFDSTGTPQAQYAAPDAQPRRVRITSEDERIFQRMRVLYTMQGGTDPIATPLPDDLRPSHRTGTAAVQYAGLQRLGGPSPLHWVLVRVEPRDGLLGTSGNIPRVLLPDGSYSDLYAELSLAVFEDGILQRSQGPHVGEGRLAAPLLQRLQNETSFWVRNHDHHPSHITHYRTVDADANTVVAVRLPTLMAFDHLYYLFRMTIAAFGIGGLLYLLGLGARYLMGLVPASRIRFRDKVLNAFLGVGVAAAVAVGIVGVQVVKDETERTADRRLSDALTRVEETLALEAQSDERIFRAVERTDMNTLAIRVGTDLDVYENGLLTDTSRPRLVRDGLVEPRLPISVYHALHTEGRRFATAETTIGTFSYRVGYQALTDEQGRTRFVIAVPTLAQQDQLEEEQSRTLAYLFGALLMLVIVVMITASLLANAIAKPIGQLREGLEAVGEGRFARILPVDTRDEIGELVHTFNEMRDQLAEQRRKLAQQERELAWREMARQVAHEIKNPLTPMKLSIQHLQRAFQRHQSTISEQDTAFTDLFERITSTLIDQINTLSRIANEFSSFARLPTRVLEPLDLNEVTREGVELMREEAPPDSVTAAWHPQSLVVEADREELRRVIINLLKNALQAIPEERAPDIRVITAQHPSNESHPHGTAEVIVRDNGVGIPPEMHEKIFQPNFSTKTSGTGLGLAIAYKTIKELDGTITFTTTEDEGTTFRVRLPLSEPVNA